MVSVAIVLAAHAVAPEPTAAAAAGSTAGAAGSTAAANADRAATLSLVAGKHSHGEGCCP
jgi:hypothetical protein